jgi:hypothetical protein
VDRYRKFRFVGMGTALGSFLLILGTMIRRIRGTPLFLLTADG